MDSPKAVPCTLSESAIERDIARIEAAQIMMREVNHAIAQNDLSVFRRYKLPAKLIDQLMARHRRDLAPYPESLFQHNMYYLEMLTLTLTNLRNARHQASRAAVGTGLLHHSVVFNTTSAVGI